ncbi:MAG: hypothetical protein WCK06_03740, partial [Actinomycetota bacterium]
YRTAGGGGWKDRLERDPEAVVFDVAAGLVSREKALSAYGVVLTADGKVSAAETETERASQRETRGEFSAFDFGPTMEEVLERCEAETGLPAPKRAKPIRWSPLEDGDVALARVRASLIP